MRALPLQPCAHATAVVGPHSRARGRSVAALFSARMDGSRVLLLLQLTPRGLSQPLCCQLAFVCTQNADTRMVLRWRQQGAPVLLLRCRAACWMCMCDNLPAAFGCGAATLFVAARYREPVGAAKALQHAPSTEHAALRAGSNAAVLLRGGRPCHVLLIVVDSLTPLLLWTVLDILTIVRPSRTA